MLSKRLSRYEFGEFVADVATGELYRNGQRVALQEKPFKFLSVLLEINGAVVTREELSRRLWPDTHVQVDQGLNAAARKVRLALGDDASNPRYIETLGSRGYRFIGSYVRKSAAPEPRKKIRIAVVPFQNDSHLSQVVCEGLLSEFVSQLGSQGELFPISGVHVPGESPEEHAALHRTLDAAYLVRGKIEGDGREVRVSTELFSEQDTRPVWTWAFESRTDELSTLQSKIALQVGNIVLQNANSRSESPGRVVEFSAYENYMRGRHFWSKRNPPALLKSLEYFEKSIEQEPGYALAYAGLADSYIMLAIHGTILPREGFEQARHWASRALELQPELPQGLVPLALAQLAVDYDQESARRGLMRAIELNPSYSFAHRGYSHLLMATGDTEASITTMKRGRDLDPLSLPLNALLSNAYYYARQYPAAAKQAELTLELDTQFPIAQAAAGLAYWALGRQQDALRAFEKAVVYSAESPVMIAHLAYALAGSASEARASEIVAELSNVREPDAAPSFHIALVHLALGDREAAFDWIERACEERSYWTLFLGVDPRVDPLRSDERFKNICKSLKHISF